MSCTLECIKSNLTYHTTLVRTFLYKSLQLGQSFLQMYVILCKLCFKNFIVINFQLYFQPNSQFFRENQNLHFGGKTGIKVILCFCFYTHYDIIRINPHLTTLEILVKKTYVCELCKKILTRKGLRNCGIIPGRLIPGDYIGLKHSKSQQYIDENSIRTYISMKEFPVKYKLLLTYMYINKWLIIMIKWLNIVVNRTIGLKVLL